MNCLIGALAMSDRNLAADRSFIADWNNHDPNAWVNHFADDSVYESQSIPKSPLKGHSEIKMVMSVYVGAFPDVDLEILQQIASDPFVVTRAMARGTHRGDLTGISPTNRQVAVELCLISEYRNGKIQRFRAYWDNVTLLRQLGVMPAQA